MRHPSRSTSRLVPAFIGLGALFALAVVGLVLALGGTHASASSLCTDTYDGPSGGSWTTAANWSTGAVPGPADFACIPSSDGTITYSDSGTTTTIESLYSVGSGTSLDIAAGALVFQDSNVASQVNALTINGGALVSYGPLTMAGLTMSSGSLSGNGQMTATSLAWTGGNFGTSGGGGSVTVSGTATVQLSTASGTSVISQMSLVLDGATSLEAAATDSGFSIGSGGSLVFADTTTTPANEPQIAEGYSIGGGGSVAEVQVQPGVTLNVTGSSDATTTISVPLADDGAVTVPSGETLAVVGGGTSSGDFELTGATLNLVRQTVLSSGAITGSGTTTLAVDSDSIFAPVSVSDITEDGTNSTYFYGTVTATTIQTGLSSGGNQEYLDFDGPTTTTTNLDVYGGGVSGTGALSTSTFTWTAGYLGNQQSGGSITVSGQATIDLSTQASTYSLANLALVLDGPATLEAPSTDPGFEIGSNGSIQLADTTTKAASEPQIAEGLTIYSGGSDAHLEVQAGVTLNMSGSDGNTTEIEVPFDNNGTVNVPGTGTLYLENGGTSPGQFNLDAGVLEVRGVNFDGTGTQVDGTDGGPSGSSVFGVDNSSISGGVSVYQVQGDASNSTYFYSTVSAAVVETGPSTASSPESALVFDGPTVSTTALDLYGGGIGGSAAISTSTLTWNAGTFGATQGGGSVTVSGQATLDLSTQSSVPQLSYTALYLDGPAKIEAPATDPGFEVGDDGALVFADTTTVAASEPQIAEGVTLYNGGGSAHVDVEPGVTLNLSGSDGNNTTVEVNFDNSGTVDVPGTGTLVLTDGGVSPGLFNLDGGILSATNVDFDGTGTQIVGTDGAPSGASELLVDQSSISGNVDVATISAAAGGTTYFYGTVTAGLIETGLASNGAAQQYLDFYGPSTTATTLTLNGDGVLSSAGLDTTTLNWNAGDLGSASAGGTITVSGTATIDLSTAEGADYLSDEQLFLDGPASIEAPVSDPGFALYNDAALVFADTTTTAADEPQVAEGETIGGSSSNVEVAPGVTFNLSGTSDAPVTIEVPFDNSGTVEIPTGAVLSLTDGGSSTGAFVFNGATLEASGATFDGTGTQLSGTGSSVLDTNNDSISSNLSVGTLGEDGATPSYFYGSVTASSLVTGASAGTSPQGEYYFAGPATTIATIDLYGGSLSGSGPIAATSLTWTGGSFGTEGGGGTVTVSGSATLTLSWTATYSEVDDMALLLDGPTAVTTTTSSPGFQIGYQGSLVFGDASSEPTIASGVTIYTGGGSAILEIGPGVTLDAQGTVNVDPPIENRGGTLLLPAGAALKAENNYTQYGGVTDLSADSTLESNVVTLLGGVLEGVGTVAPYSYSATTIDAVAGVVEAGTGTAAGTLTISGALEIGNGAALDAYLDGTSTGASYSAVDATTAVLAGTLDLVPTSGYKPAAGATWNVLVTTSTPTGVFGLATPAEIGTQAYTVTYSSTGVTAAVPAAAVVRLSLHESTATSAKGQPVTFTATVVGAPAGATVTFYDGGRRIGAGPLAVSGGVATLTVRTLAVGSHTITARLTTQRGGQTSTTEASLHHEVRAVLSAHGGATTDPPRTAGDRARRRVTAK